MYQKILVPLDGSNRAEKILPHVEELAAHYQASVTLLQIIPPAGDILTAGVITPLPDQLDSEKKLAESYLNSIRAGLQAKQIETRTRVVVSGQVADAIVKIADEEKINLVAMSSHGHSGLSRVFYGSVAAGLLHQIDRPLLIIRSRKVSAAVDHQIPEGGIALFSQRSDELLFERGGLQNSLPPCSTSKKQGRNMPAGDRSGPQNPGPMMAGGADRGRGRRPDKSWIISLNTRCARRSGRISSTTRTRIARRLSCRKRVCPVSSLR